MISKERVRDLANECLPKILLNHYKNQQQQLEGSSTTRNIEIDDSNIIIVQQLCRLWSGKGYIYKVTVKDITIVCTDSNKTEKIASLSFILKNVTASNDDNKKSLSLGDRRKANSYIVEANFYRYVADTVWQQPYYLELPRPFLIQGPTSLNDDDDKDTSTTNNNGEIIICMSYLDGQSFDEAYYNNYGGIGSNNTSISPAHLALNWLATFHACNWNVQTTRTTTTSSSKNKSLNNSIDDIIDRFGLQKTGSYWHLDTRPDEHASMPRRGWEGRLKRAARAIDQCIKRDPMQTLIHGDPKSANIMLVSSPTLCQQQNQQEQANTNKIVAAFYDFQYCGKGSPSQDLAYFLCGSCDKDDEEELIKHYYNQLTRQLQSKQERLSHEYERQQQNHDQEQHHDDKKQFIYIPTLGQLQDSLAIAYCDFCRFMSGWGYWGSDVSKKVKEVLDRLDNGKDLGSEDAYDDAIRRVFW